MTVVLSVNSEIEVNDRTRLVKPKYLDSGTHRLVGVRVEYETWAGDGVAEAFRGLSVYVLTKQVRKDGTDSGHPVRTQGSWGDEPVPLLEEEWKRLIQQLIADVIAVIAEPLRTEITDDIVKRAEQHNLA